MRYIIISLLCCYICMSGCAHMQIVKVPKPVYPSMRDIKVTNGCVCGTMLTDLIDNMLKLQIHVDELSTNPCWEDK